MHITVMLLCFLQEHSWWQRSCQRMLFCQQWPQQGTTASLYAVLPHTAPEELSSAASSRNKRIVRLWVKWETAERPAERPSELHFLHWAWPAAAGHYSSTATSSPGSCGRQCSERGCRGSCALQRAWGEAAGKEQEQSSLSCCCALAVQSLDSPAFPNGVSTLIMMDVFPFWTNQVVTNRLYTNQSDKEFCV